MKKRFAFFMMLTMLASLAGCGGTTNQGTETEPQTGGEMESSSGETTAEVLPTEESGQAAPGGSTETTENSPYVHVVLESCRTDVSNPETYQQKAYVEYVKMSLTEADAARYPELAAGFAAYNEQEQTRNEELMQELETSYEEMYAEGNPYDDVLYNVIKGSVLRADSRLVSIHHNYEGYWGGMHGSYSYSALNFDTRTGKRMSFADMVQDMDRFWELADAQLQENYSDIYEEMIPIPQYLEGIDPEAVDMIAWSADYDGVTVYFNPYILGSYAIGAQSVKICYDDAPELFNEAYLPTVEDYVTAVPAGHMTVVDADGDGKREMVSIQPIFPEEYEDNGYLGWDLQAGDRTLKIEDWCYSQESYLIRANGQYKIYMFERSDNDYTVPLVIDLKTLERKDPFGTSVNLHDISWDWEELNAGVTKTAHSRLAFTDPTAFEMVSRLEILGSHSGIKTYHVDEDGSPKADQEAFALQGSVILEASQDVACRTVTAEGTVTGDTVIPKGTYLYFVRTDGSTWVDMQIIDSSKVVQSGSEEYPNLCTEETMELDETAEIYRIEVDTTEYPRKVNGMDEEAVFRGIIYAG